MGAQLRRTCALKQVGTKGGNGASGTSDIEGKVARVATSVRGQEASFNLLQKIAPSANAAECRNAAHHLSVVNGHFYSVVYASNTQRQMLLRSGRDRGKRPAARHGLLSLRELPALFNRAGERVHCVEVRQRASA